MPPKVTDNQQISTDTFHTLGNETRDAAQIVVATYADDLGDAAMLMGMLGVEPEGMIYRRIIKEIEETKKSQTASKKASKRTKKAPVKKATKKVTAKKTTAKKTAAKKASSKSAE